MSQPFFKHHYEKKIYVKYLIYATILFCTSYYVLASTPLLKTHDFSIEVEPPNDYVLNQLNLERMEGANSPIGNIDIVKKRLKEYNEDLVQRGMPLIYLGLANKEDFFNAPYFLNRYKIGEVSNEDLAQGYAESLGLKESRNDLGVEFGDIKAMLKTDYSSKSASLFADEASRIDEKAIVITKYYYGLLKTGSDPSIQSVKVQWLSAIGYQLSGSLIGKQAIDKPKLKAHYKSLQSLQEDETLRLIESWYNYLIDKELPKEQEKDAWGLAALDNSEACRNLTKEEGDQKAAELITAIEENNKEIAQKVLSTCYPVIESLDYKYKIKAIRYLVTGIVSDYKETVILRLMHSIPSSSFGTFFVDLKEEKDGHTLMNDLLDKMDDISILFPSDGENLTSLIEEFKRMGSANSGEHFKRERIYLLESLLASINNMTPTMNLLEGVHSIATYELQFDEIAYGNYLIEDSCKNLLRVFNYGSLGVRNRELLITSGNDLGSFLASQEKHNVFVELPEVIFSESGDDNYNQIGIHAIAGLYKHLPKENEAVYEYLSVEAFKKLKFLIEKVHTIKASQLDAVLEVTTNSFYEGVTNLLDFKASINDRIDLVKWVLDKEGDLQDYRSFFLHIFDNIVASNDRKKVYDFLTKGLDYATVDYYYLKKITTKGVLSGDERQISFLKYYMGLINEHGSVLDREYLLRNVLNEEDDWSYLKWHDTEDLVSVLFTNLSPNDGIYLQGIVSANNYQMFKDIWGVMENAVLWTTVDRDNKRFEEFVVSFSKLFTKDSYSSIYENQSYLNIAEKPEIESIANHIPFVRTRTINIFGEHTDYSLTSEIEKEGTGSEIISVKVELGNEVLVDKKFAPFDPVFIEFIDDTEISPGVQFNKGDVILVPAFYVAWMDGSISSQNINSTLRVGTDFIVAAISGATIAASGGALAPVLFGSAEILFSFADASIAMFEGELREEFGEEFINDIEIANLIWGLANLPMGAASGVVVIKTVSGKIYRSGKQAIRNIKSGITEIRIKPTELFEHLSTYSKKLSGMGSWEKAEIMESLLSIEVRMKARVKSFSSNLSKADYEKYRIVQIALYAMYLDQVPELAQLVLAYPNKFKIDIVDKVLKMRYGNKTFCNITTNGVLQDINLTNINESALLSNLEINNFQASVKYGDVIFEDVLQVVVKENGEPVFMRGFKEGFTRKGHLLNEYPASSPVSTPKLLYPANADVTDVVLKSGSEIYALEQEGQRGEIIMALNKKSALTNEELQLMLSGLTPANDIENLLIVEYETHTDLNVRELIMGTEDPYSRYGIIEKPDGSIEEVSVESLSEYLVTSTTLTSNFDAKALNKLITKKFEEYRDGILDEAALLTSVKNEINNSDLPQSIKLEIGKIEDEEDLSNILEAGGEALFELANSNNTEIVEYTVKLIDLRLSYYLGTDEAFTLAIANAEKVFELPVVSSTIDITSESGGLSIILSGEFEGKPAIFKHYRRPVKNGADKIENVVKRLEPYGGAKYYGRARVMTEDGIWQEVVAIERIDGYDVSDLLRRKELNSELPIQVTQMHLDAIDAIIEKLASEGKILMETNLGDIMLTNDPERAVVLFDMIVEPGNRNAQGLLGRDYKPFRDTVEELIKNTALTSNFDVNNVPEHVWPLPYPPVPDGDVKIADLIRIQIDEVTGALQGEVKEAIVDRKAEEILAILNEEPGGKKIPVVRMAPDPNVPGGFVLTDQTHTYAAYKKLGFDEIPASIYNESNGVPFLIRHEAYNLDNYAPISELKTVPEFTGTPSQQAAKRREALEEQNADDVSWSIKEDITNVSPEYKAFMTSSIIDEVTRLKGNIAENLMPLYPQLSYEEIIASVYFTTEKQMDYLANLSTLLIVHDHLNELDNANRIFAELLESVITKIPKNNNSSIVYSGNTPFDIFYSADEYEVGEFIKLNTYLVGSNEKQIAASIISSRKNEFLEEGIDEDLLPVFFEIHNSQGHNLGSLSAQPELIQILFDKKDTYKVLNRRVESINGMQVNYIVIEHLGDSNVSIGNEVGSTNLGLGIGSDDLLDTADNSPLMDDLIANGLQSMSKYTPSSDFSLLPNFEDFKNDPIISSFLEEFSERLSSDSFGIVAEEFAALAYYSYYAYESPQFSVITALRTPSLSIDNPTDYFINSALEKLPVDTQNKTVFIPANKNLREQALNWQIGNSINFKGNLLATTSFESAQKEMLTVLIEVQNSKGHNISEILTESERYDYIFKANTHSIVKSIESTSVDGKFGTYIVIEQTDGNTLQSSNSSNTKIETTQTEEPLPNNVVPITRTTYKKVYSSNFIHVLVYETETGIFKQYFNSEEDLYRTIDALLISRPSTKTFISLFKTEKDLRFLSTPIEVNEIGFNDFSGIEFKIGDNYIAHLDLESTKNNFLEEVLIDTIPDKYTWIFDPRYFRVMTEAQLFEEMKFIIQQLRSEYSLMMGYEDFLKSENIMTEIRKIILSDNFSSTQKFVAEELVVMNDFLYQTTTTPLFRRDLSLLTTSNGMFYKYVLNRTIEKLEKTDTPLVYKALTNTEFNFGEEAITWDEGDTFTLPDFLLASVDEIAELNKFSTLSSTNKILLVIRNPNGSELRELVNYSNQIFLNSKNEYEVIESSRVQSITGGTIHRILIEQKNKI